MNKNKKIIVVILVGIFVFFVVVGLLIYGTKQHFGDIERSSEISLCSFTASLCDSIKVFTDNASEIVETCNQCNEKCSNFGQEYVNLCWQGKSDEIEELLIS